MYGWGGSGKRCVGTADADCPSAATLEARRERDIIFLNWVRAAGRDELECSLRYVTVQWRRIAIERRIRMASTES